jgi:hypothetical protein
MTPGDTWQKGRGPKRRARLEDKLADAIDAEERARAKMRRTFHAWEKAAALVERLNKSITKEVQS